MSTLSDNYISIHEKIGAGLLLATVGGFLDAYTYLECGGVFANAQTGNLVLLGIALINGQLAQCWLYLTPVIAFALGIMLTQLTRQKLSQKQFISWQQPILALEIIILFFIFLQPNLDHTTTNITISFIASLQVNTFRVISGTPYASTMCTGNLRSAFEYLSSYLFEHNKAALKHSARYCLVIVFFCLGCSAGAVSISYFGKASILVCAILLLPLLAMIIYENLRLYHKR